MNETDTLTWRTPVLKTLIGGTDEFNGQYFVSRRSTEMVRDFNDYWDYVYVHLRFDGTWHDVMCVGGGSVGGTYFKTLQEVIDVLCEFNIHVIGPDDEEE